MNFRIVGKRVYASGGCGECVSPGPNLDSNPGKLKIRKSDQNIRAMVADIGLARDRSNQRTAAGLVDR